MAYGNGSGIPPRLTLSMTANGSVHKKPSNIAVKNRLSSGLTLNSQPLLARTGFAVLVSLARLLERFVAGGGGRDLHLGAVQQLLHGEDLHARIIFLPQVGVVEPGAGGFADHLARGLFEREEDADLRATFIGAFCTRSW